MSSTTIDYDAADVDAGGDKAFDSSNYGTTTGDLSPESKSQGDLGSGSSKGNTGTKSSVTVGGIGGSTEGLRANNQDVANHEQWGKNEGHAGQLGGQGGAKSEAPAGESDGGMTGDEARNVQGYSKTGDMNPEIGG